MSFIVDGAIVVAVAAGVAVYKHFTKKTAVVTAPVPATPAPATSSAIATEVAKLEALGSKISADAKADFTAAIAKIKSLL